MFPLNRALHVVFVAPAVAKYMLFSEYSPLSIESSWKKKKSPRGDPWMRKQRVEAFEKMRAAAIGTDRRHVDVLHSHDGDELIFESSRHSCGIRRRPWTRSDNAARGRLCSSPKLEAPIPLSVHTRIYGIPNQRHLLYLFPL